MVLQMSDSKGLTRRFFSAKGLRAFRRPCGVFISFLAWFQVQSTEKNVSGKKGAARGMLLTQNNISTPPYRLFESTAKYKCRDFAEITGKVGLENNGCGMS